MTKVEPPLVCAADERERSAASASATKDAEARLRAMMNAHHDFVWRSLRFLGVPDANVEDAAQQVFCVVARRLGDIAPGAEMAFLFSTASRIASEARRALRRRPGPSSADVDALESPLPSADQLIDQQYAREVLREVLEAMPVELRMVFVLFEIEELPTPAIAELLAIRPGTAASRLRRAREVFQSILKRRQAATSRRTGGAHR